MTGAQLESDKISGLVTGGNRATVLFEEAGEVDYMNLPVGLQVKVRRKYSKSDYNALKRIWAEFESRIQAQDGVSKTCDLLDALRLRAEKYPFRADISCPEVHPALIESSEQFIVEDRPDAKVQANIEQYERRTQLSSLNLPGFKTEVPYIPNWYKKGDFVPYMPGAGEPHLEMVARIRKLLHEKR